MNLNEIVQRVYASPALRTYLKINISGDPKVQKKAIHRTVSALTRQDPTFQRHLMARMNQLSEGE